MAWQPSERSKKTPLPFRKSPWFYVPSIRVLAFGMLFAKESLVGVVLVQPFSRDLKDGLKFEHGLIQGLGRRNGGGRPKCVLPFLGRNKPFCPSPILAFFFAAAKFPQGGHHPRFYHSCWHSERRNAGRRLPRRCRPVFRSPCAVCGPEGLGRPIADRKHAFTPVAEIQD